MTSIYIAVAIVAVAAQPSRTFEGQEAGLSAILEDVTGSTWPATVLAAGAVISIFSVTLVVIYGQTRILFAMGRDGMIPPLFHKREPAHAHARCRRRSSSAVVISLLAGLRADQLPRRDDEHRHAGRLPRRVGRRDRAAPHAPDLPRGFKVPGYPVTPILSIAGCFWIIKDLRAVTIYVFLIWAAVALVWYFFYGIHHSTLGSVGEADSAPEEAA